MSVGSWLLKQKLWKSYSLSSESPRQRQELDEWQGELIFDSIRLNQSCHWVPREIQLQVKCRKPSNCGLSSRNDRWSIAAWGWVWLQSPWISSGKKRQESWREEEVPRDEEPTTERFAPRHWTLHCHALLPTQVLTWLQRLSRQRGSWVGPSGQVRSLQHQCLQLRAAACVQKLSSPGSTLEAGACKKWALWGEQKSECGASNNSQGKEHLSRNPLSLLREVWKIHRSNCSL